MQPTPFGAPRILPRAHLLTSPYDTVMVPDEQQQHQASGNASRARDEALLYLCNRAGKYSRQSAAVTPRSTQHSLSSSSQPESMHRGHHIGRKGGVRSVRAANSGPMQHHSVRRRWRSSPSVINNPGSNGLPLGLQATTQQRPVVQWQGAPISSHPVGYTSTPREGVPMHYNFFINAPESSGQQQQNVFAFEQHSRAGQYLIPSPPPLTAAPQINQPPCICTLPQHRLIPPLPPPTTLMMRNIPNRYVQGELLSDIKIAGFADAFDFFYLPMDRNTGANFGYCFINMLTPQLATDFHKAFDAKPMKRFMSRKIVSIVPATIQGFEANLKHYSQKAVCADMKTQFRPLFWVNGTAIEFLRKSYDNATYGTALRNAGSGDSGSELTRADSREKWRTESSGRSVADDDGSGQQRNVQHDHPPSHYHNHRHRHRHHHHCHCQGEKRRHHRTKSVECGLSHRMPPPSLVTSPTASSLP